MQRLECRELMRVVGVGFRAAKEDARDEEPHATEAFHKGSVAEKIARVSEAKELDEHVEVERFAHLWLHDAEVASDMPEDARLGFRGQAVRKGRTWRATMEESLNDQTNSVVETLCRCKRILHDHFVKFTRVLAE